MRALWIVAGLGVVLCGGCAADWRARAFDEKVAATPIQPVYCYNSLATVDCYAEPRPGENHKIVGYQGGPPPSPPGVGPGFR